MFQIFVVGSDKAVEFYQRAFDAKLVAAYPKEDGTYMHAELDVYGQIFAVSESDSNESNPGNTMMLCLEFGKGNADKVYKAYEVLKEGAQPHEPVDVNSGYSEHQFALVDKFGVYWCIFE
jgi:PhnB protein